MKVDVGTETYDAFADVDFATTYLGGDVLRATVWALKDPDTQARGLVSATRLIQRLGWCVDPAPLPDDADIPLVLQEATAMLAADLIAKPAQFADASGNSNIKSVKAGSAQVEFFSPIKGGPPLPRAVWDMLVNAGLVGCGFVGGEINGTPYISGTQGDCRPLGGWWASDDDWLRDRC
jgi:hypothetical protein